MRIIQRIRLWHIFATIALAVVVLIVVVSSKNGQGEALATTTAEYGSVRETVSVSGYIEAKNTANLSFPTVGIVTDVMVAEGDIVAEGEVLATLGARTLVAQRQEAVAALTKAQNNYNALQAGPSESSRLEIDQTLNSARVQLAQVTALENEKVETARINLLSNDLTAYALDADTNQPAPTISGSYLCEDEGSYTIEVYRSGAYSGFSYRLSGLEEATAAGYTQQSSSLGTCGLTIQFTEDESYATTDWIVPIPNTQSNTYSALLSAYELALENRTTAIANAEAALAVAEATAGNAVADPTIYENTDATSAIMQAQAAIDAIDAQISEKSIIAPFAGIITDVDILKGEIAGSAPIITLLADDAFTLTARVPEIDITKVVTDLATEVVFDANSSELLKGYVSFVSPLATEIDGVAYFETTITLEENRDWIRSGLNADIEIIISEMTDQLTLPKRFIQEDEAGVFVDLVHDDESERTSIEVLFSGNDGHAAVTGINAGDTISVPEAE